MDRSIPPWTGCDLNSLVRPLAVTLNGPACTDPARANSTSQILESNGTPLSCED